MTSKICRELARPKRDLRRTRTTSAQRADEFSYRFNVRLMAAAVVLAVGLSACGGGGSSPPPRSVALAWEANRESGVNRAGGGYQVSISGQPTIDVPYTSGPAAPTSTTVLLQPGSYTVTVRAYAALNSQGGNAGSLSAPSQSLTVNVP